MFASGRGTNFSAIARAVKKGKIRAELALLVCDQPRAAVIAKAKRARVKVFLARLEDFSCKNDFEAGIIRRLKAEKIGLIALAGFMRLLSPEFVRAFKNKILNIHPALLPAFKGGHAIRDAFAYGAKVTGVTVHFVDEQMDHGPVILQQAISLRPGEGLASLEARIHRLEHRLYPQAIKLAVEGRLRLKGRKVCPRAN